MKLLRKSLLILAISAFAAFAGCGGNVGGAPAGDVGSGLSSDYLLANLAVDAPSLYNEDDPSASRLQLKYKFSPVEWENELDVPNAIDIVTVTATTSHPRAHMFIGDTEITNGDPSGPISLAVGVKEIEVRVVAEDGQEITYTITATRHTEAFENATLTELTVGGTVLDVSGGNTSFSLSESSTSISIDAALPEDAVNEGATFLVTVNDNGVSDINSVPLAEGMNTVKIICTAADGVTVVTYMLNINRPVASPSVRLVALGINGISFDKEFTPDTAAYSANASASMSPVTLVAQAESSTATVSVDVEGPTKSYTNVALNAVPLEEGSNIITVTVKNPLAVADGVYTVTVNCTTASSNANLKSLKVGIGTSSLRPIYPGTFERNTTYHDPNITKFSKTTRDYVTVIYGFSSLKLTAVVDDSTAKNVQFSATRKYKATSGETPGGVTSQSFAAGTATATIELDQGYVTQVVITVTAASGATQDYRLSAKLLNADEFYWGIYAPSMDQSKATWSKPSTGGTWDRDGYVSGHVDWIVITSPVTSTIVLANYNDGNDFADDVVDGKQDFLYNEGGFIANGTHEAKLKSITVKDGWDLTKNPPFLLKTAQGEDFADLDYHLWISNADPAEQADSYTGIKYMNATGYHNQLYVLEDADAGKYKPYPFFKKNDSTYKYDWFNSWSDGQ